MILPAANTCQLSELVTLMFPARFNAHWIAELPDDVLHGLRALFDYDVSAHEHHVDDRLSRDLLAALHTLTCQTSSTGLSKFVR